MPRNPGVYTCAFCPHSPKMCCSVLRVLNAVHHYLPSAYCILLLFIAQHVALITVRAQSATATLSGSVRDQNDASIAGANVAVISTAQGFQRTTTTNDEGNFLIQSLPPGSYTVKADHKGFAPAEVRNVVLNVNAYIQLPIFLKIGNLVEQKVEVLESPSLIDETPSVGGSVDSRLIMMPLNGRSFQQLLTFSPGIVLTKATGVEQGQFSVNGQRANANSFYIDGVSANIGVPTNAAAGQTASGSLPGFSASGGTNNLVSIDALQEFKVETSSYAPEFGRTPGAQVVIATRSGTNDFHGTLFEYFRNDVLDANDWFANSRGQTKSPLRQNDFGGVLGGPLLIPRFGEGGRQPWYNGRDRTFFFFSYEGLRLRQPLFVITDVPSLSARQAAPVSIQPFLNAFPRPTGPARANNFAEFAAGFSNPSSFDATSLRIDHHVNDKLILFGRYNNSPSESVQRGVLSTSLNTLDRLRVETQTLTGGATILLNPSMVAELRANYSHNLANKTSELDSFGGATVPGDAVLFPSFASSADSSFTFRLLGGTSVALTAGRGMKNLQRQLNLVNSLAVVSGAHELKFGVDFRRLSPSLGPRVYSQSVNFLTGVNGALLGRASSVNIQSQTGPIVPIYLNFSIFGQDNWKVTRRFSLTYGLRYEINPPPSEANNRHPATLLQVDDPKTFALAPSGRPLWKTTYNNLAPRVGVHFQLSQEPGREAALRGGYGIFYDLGSGVGGQAFINFPYSGLRTLSNVPFPLTSASDVAPPAVGFPLLQFFAFDPNLKLPYTHQWNLAIEQSLGRNQTVSASYVAALGRRLLREELLAGAILTGNPLFTFLSTVPVTRNAATSDYHSFQLKFQRRLTKNLQVLSYYTWSHSIDTASNESTQFAPALILDPKRDRGSSDFDVRHSFNAAVAYDLPTPRIGKFGRSIFGGWTIETIVAVRSATPVDVTSFRDVGFGAILLRPDLIEGVPLYLNDSNVARGRRFNPAAFRIPIEQRQGTLGRNALRGFPFFQTDFGLGRRFDLTEALKLEFKAEFFNLFNHPNFGDPVGSLTDARFGTSFRMYARGLGTGGTLGGLNPLYQVGGPRSVQLSLRARF